jgi:hypothetical protein
VSRTTHGVIAAGTISVVLFAFAFWVAPSACDGGFELYFGAGLVALLVLLALPFAVRSGSSILVRIGWALGFVVLGAVVWVAGLFAANVNFLCRLF